MHTATTVTRIALALISLSVLTGTGVVLRDAHRAGMARVRRATRQRPRVSASNVRVIPAQRTR